MAFPFVELHEYTLRKAREKSVPRQVTTAMIVAGIMSGTSADGIDVALVRVQGRPPALRFELLHHYAVAYPAALRRAVLAAMAASRASVPDLARLNVRLSVAYADAVMAACKEAGVARPELVGCHGQTIYHQGYAASYVGERVVTTWQLGDGDWIAARCGAPVISDLRQADMAAGGKGAPLVPFFDFLAFTDRKRQRIALNLGGIANITVLAARAKPSEVVAFDTGPGNMVIDAAMELLTRGKRTFDANGRLAAKGRVDERVLNTLLEAKYFRQKPPKSAGREEFGEPYARAVLQKMRSHKQEDVVATITALTVRSVADAVRRFAPEMSSPIRGSRPRGDVIASGGGTKNATMMRMLGEELTAMGYRLSTSDEYGVPSQAKEAIAFAVLAYESYHGRPANLPSATGATRPVVLGKLSRL